MKYSSIFGVSEEHSDRLHFQHLTWRRLAATGLAVRLHRARHGHLPRTLDELVPEYLPRIPTDPFAADGRTIAYSPDGDPPIVYSIGSDGVDDHGQFILRGGYLRAYKCDFPFLINGDRSNVEGRTASKPTGSGQTEKDADDGEDAERENEEEEEAEQEP